FSQQGIWLFEQLTGNRSAYLLSEAWRLRGPLDVEALRRALETIVARHPCLRTQFFTVEGRPVQTGAAPSRFTLDTLVAPFASSTIEEAELASLVSAEADRPFDLTHGLLLRAALVPLSDDNFILVITVHHIASDAWSQQILRRELEALYRAYRLRL